MKSSAIPTLPFPDSLPLAPSFAFSDHASDEFRIRGPAGKTEWIFKIWPSRILEALEGSSLDDPLKRLVVMKKWLARTMLQDRALQDAFLSVVTGATDPTDLAGRLFACMEWAFVQFEPFYCLEAMIDDRSNSGETAGGGEIDLVALLLPGIFRESLSDRHSPAEMGEVAERLRAWFRDDPDSSDGRKFALLALLSRKLDISFVECLFAAKILGLTHPNAPAGSEKSAIDTCVGALSRSFRRNSDRSDKNAVDADANARIRFMNWLPIGLADGDGMNYDAVCAPASRLFDAVRSRPELLNEESRSAFEAVAPQLANLDASSARGRFLLRMFSDGWFAPGFVRAAEDTRSRLRETLAAAPFDPIIPFSDTNGHLDRSQVGGKGTGLALAREVFGPEAVVPTVAISWVAIQEWLHGIDGFDARLESLARASSHEELARIGRELRAKIVSAGLPDAIVRAVREAFPNESLIILRSSAVTEDAEHIGPAPGIYESIQAENEDASVRRAVKQVVTSFFGEAALAFRQAKGMCHTPLMAVLAQPVLPWRHVHVFAHPDTILMNVSESNVNAQDGRYATLREDDDLGDPELNEARRLAGVARTLFGPVDMEFMLSDGRAAILQLRMLDHAEPSDTLDAAPVALVRRAVGSMEDLSDLLGGVRGSDAEARSIRLEFHDDLDFNGFQERLASCIIMLRGSLGEIVLPCRIAPTSHLSNIIRTL